MFKIEKLSESNFHVWKQKVELILQFKELGAHIEDSEKQPTGSDDAEKWFKDDAKAKAVIGLTLSDEHLEHVRDCVTAASMWSTITDLFQRKTLLNKLTTRRRFYSAKMADSEKAMAFISRVRQLGADCKAMGVAIDDQEMAMTVLCGLPPKYEHLIVAIDAAADDKSLSMDFVKSRLLQEEQRMLDRDDVKSAADAALVNKQHGAGGNDVVVCGHCGKNHPDSKCWSKHPHLRPRKANGKGKGAGLAAKGPDPDIAEADTDVTICLMAHTSDDNVTLASRASWIIDSGATSHICNDRRMFANLDMVKLSDIRIGDKSNVKAVGRGSIEVSISVRGKPRKCILENVVYAPTMAFNMLSVRVMNRTGKRTVFEEHSCHVEKDGTVLVEGSVKDGLYCLNTIDPVTVEATESAMVADINLWHQRMAHVHCDGIRNMVKHGVVEGVKLDYKPNVTRCEACVYGKSTRAPIPKQGATRSAKVLDLVHTDVCGPFPVPSIGGSRYFVSFVDDHTRFAWIYPIRSKSDVFDRFKQWLTMVENMHERKLRVLQPDNKLRKWMTTDMDSQSKGLKVLQSDNGGEYLSTHMTQFLRNRGIQHRLTAPYNPHQNGVAERLNRTLVELVRTMLQHKNLPKKFWAEALSVSMHVRNRVTTRGLDAKTTPYEMMFVRKPNMSYLRVFGSRCWYNVSKPHVDKLDPRAREAIMIGYARGIRGYKLWDISNEKVVTSRDVRFDESGEYEVCGHSVDNPEDSEEPSVFDDENPVDIDSSDGKDVASPPAGLEPDPVDDTGQVQDGTSEDNVDPDFVPDTDSSGTTEPKPSSESQPDVVQQRRSTRTRRPPDRFGTWSSALVSAAPTGDPGSYDDAVNGPDGTAWIDSMKSEYDSLIENKCWELVPRPPNANVISSKWVYKTKEEQTTDGALGIRRKSRLVARGFSQVQGIDYSETYAPVVKLTSVRVILALVACMGLLLHQMDVKTAFLNGDLKEVVFMEQPVGFEIGNPLKVVCRLLKSIYGLKQAPRQWYAKIDDFFIRTLGMERNPADDCVYVRRKGGHILIIALYVDDLLIACDDMDMLNETKRQLSGRFKMKDLGESRIILGMDIARDASTRTLSVSQTRYAQKVIDRLGLGSARGQPTPMDPNVDLTEHSVPCTEEYRSAIGSLMYLMVGTRPDLAYCIGTLAKHVQNPTVVHWEALKRVARYVIQTKQLGLMYGGSNAVMTPVVYVDADWAGDHETRKSMSGFVGMMGGAAVAWCARQQEVVAMSSAESEYISMCSGAKETVWLRRLVDGFGVVSGMDGPTKMFVDNQAAIALAHNASVNRRNKHIDVRFHFTRQLVEDRKLELEYCSTEDMVADVFTKALGRVKLQKFVGMLGMDGCRSALDM